MGVSQVLFVYYLWRRSFTSGNGGIFNVPSPQLVHKEGPAWCGWFTGRTGELVGDGERTRGSDNGIRVETELSTVVAGSYFELVICNHAEE